MSPHLQSTTIQSPQRPAPSVRVKILVLLIGLALALVGAELLLRLLWTPTVTVHEETRRDHPDYGFAPMADTRGRFARTEYNIEFRHSAQRMRSDKLFKKERAPGITARILFLGDSFTYSIGTELSDSFTSRIAAAWPDREIINASCTGYGQREELAVLDKLGEALKPDVTVISFFWNDVEDIRRLEPAYAVNAQGQVRRTSPPDSESDPLRLWPAQHATPRSKWKTCYFYEFARESTAAYRQKHTDKIRPNQISTPEEMDAAWRLLDEQFRLIKLRADELGSRLVVFNIPDYNLINPASVIASVKPLNFQIAERLAQVCAKHSIEFHDALPAFKAAHATATKPLYYETDRHLTVEGNRIMADFMIPILERILHTPASK